MLANRGFGLAVLFLVCGSGYRTCAQGAESAGVVSAVIENLEFKPERKAVQFEIRNLGPRPITAFIASLTLIGSDGNEVVCNAGGAEMIDWSDPMPGTNFMPGMRRKWIQPNQALHSERWFGKCSELAGSPEAARVHLEAIMYDDDSGEGLPYKVQNFLENRRVLARERIKWIGRFTSLRGTDDLLTASSQLYKDLVEAKHEAEMEPEAASSNGLLRGSQERLQEIALNIAQYAKTHRKLEEGSREAWLVTDLEQRTERVIRGAGALDVPIQ